MVNIRSNWFYEKEDTKNEIEITVPKVSLLEKDIDVLCYILAKNWYPNFNPVYTYYSYIIENDTTGYFMICGNNHQTTGSILFKLVDKKEIIQHEWK